MFNACLQRVIYLQLYIHTLPKKRHMPACSLQMHSEANAANQNQQVRFVTCQ